MHTPSDLHPLPRLRQQAAWVLLAWVLCLVIAAAAPLGQVPDDLCRSPDALHSELSLGGMKCSACLPAVAPPPQDLALVQAPTRVATTSDVTPQLQIPASLIGRPQARGPPSFI